MLSGFAGGQREEYSNSFVYVLLFVWFFLGWLFT
jgi:hypothetical protein